MSSRLLSAILVAAVAAALLNAAPSSAADPLPYQQNWEIIDSSGCLDPGWQPRCWNRSSSPVIADIDDDDDTFGCVEVEAGMDIRHR